MLLRCFPLAQCHAGAAAVTRAHRQLCTQGLVEEWGRLLAQAPQQAAPPAPAAALLADMKQLLRQAVKTQSQRLSGEVVPDTVSAAFTRLYQSSVAAAEHPAFFRLLVAELGVQEEDVTSAVEQWRATAQRRAAGTSSDLTNRSASELQQACWPLYTHLFLSFGQQPAGIKFLLGMRADLLAHLQQQPAYAADLRALSEHMRRALSSGFSVGSLGVQRLAWDSTPAGFLEKVMEGEAVHPISGWGELKGRLGAGRRVYAVTHPSMPQEPLVVLHTALLPATPSSMPEVLQHPCSGAHTSGHLEEHAATTAAFYSISAMQPGLAGVDLGNFLIKRVASLVQAEIPSIRTLVTLSPAPNFRSWLHARLLRAPAAPPAPSPSLPPAAAAAAAAGQAAGGVAPLVSPHFAAALEALAAVVVPGPERGRAGMEGLPEGQAALLQLLEGDRWLQLPAAGQEVVQQVLLRLAATYLVRERRRNLALDPVANFHLRNGAALHRILPRADMSPRGLQRSHGIMVNYLYELPEVAANNRRYLVERRVPTSPQVDALLRGC